MRKKKVARRPSIGQRLIRNKTLWGLFGLVCISGGITHGAVGCSGWDPTDPLSHNAPEVEKALAEMDAGEFRAAQEILGDYLGTGICKGSKIGVPDTVRQKPDGSFDLGLILFYLAENYGRRFGDEEKGDPIIGDNKDEMERRSEEIDCAQLILQAIAHDKDVPAELRARAYYLAGNLEFLRRHYAKAVEYYDQALKLLPGVVEEAGGDGIGRDTAWNRAIALRRMEENKADGGDDGADGDGGDGDGDGGDGDGEDGDGDGGDGDDGDGGDGDDAGDGEPDAPDGDADGDNGDGDDGNDGSGGDSGDSGDKLGDADGDSGGGDGEDGNPDDGGGDGMDGGEDQDAEPDEVPPVEEPDENGDPGSGEGEGDDELLDEFEETPTYQQEEAKKNGAKVRPGPKRDMEDK